MPELEIMASSPAAGSDAGAWSDPVIEAYKKDVDRTLIRHTLRLTVQERFENLMQLQGFAEEMRRAMRRATGER